MSNDMRNCQNPGILSLVVDGEFVPIMPSFAASSPHFEYAPTWDIPSPGISAAREVPCDKGAQNRRSDLRGSFLRGAVIDNCCHRRAALPFILSAALFLPLVPNGRSRSITLFAQWLNTKRPRSVPLAFTDFMGTFQVWCQSLASSWHRAERTF